MSAVADYMLIAYNLYHSFSSSPYVIKSLQTLRDNGTLAYSQISHKTYYKQEDVDNVMKDVKDRKKAAAWRKPRKVSKAQADNEVF